MTAPVEPDLSAHDPVDHPLIAVMCARSRFVGAADEVTKASEALTRTFGAARWCEGEKLQVLPRLLALSEMFADMARRLQADLDAAGVKERG